MPFRGMKVIARKSSAPAARSSAPYIRRSSKRAKALEVGEWMVQTMVRPPASRACRRGLGLAPSPRAPEFGVSGF